MRCASRQTAEVKLKSLKFASNAFRIVEAPKPTGTKSQRLLSKMLNPFGKPGFYLVSWKRASENGCYEYVTGIKNGMLTGTTYLPPNVDILSNGKILWR